MRVLIVASQLDPAGSGLHRALAASFGSTDDSRFISTGSARFGAFDCTLGLIDGSVLDFVVPEGFDLVIFCSKHRAASENNAMCVHAIGNFGEARFGGENGRLVPTHPGVLSALYRALRARGPRTEVGAYEVSLEAVHHGPYATTPSIFYELGSSERNWQDSEAATIMAQVLLDTLTEPIEPRSSFFGLGSNHYCAGFSRLVERYDFAGSCPKFALPDLTADHLRWIAGRYDHIVLDWNSMGPEKRRIVGMLDDLGISYERRKAMERFS